MVDSLTVGRRWVDEKQDGTVMETGRNGNGNVLKTKDLHTVLLAFLARDFFGIKPLYYTYWQDGFAFASEIKALLQLPGVNRRVNPQRLYDYLHSGLTDYGSETLFADIKQLPPAHFLKISLDKPQQPQIEQYWHLELNQHSDITFKEAKF